jgi:glycosyltransferase involved in cell wall biosynthesis
MGAGYQAHYLANILVRRGHAVTVFSICPKPVDAIYEVHHLNARRSMRSLRVSWQMRGIRWSKFDVLHAHGYDWFLCNPDVPPHVRTMHGACLAEAKHIPGVSAKVHMLWLTALETLSCAVADLTVGVSINTCRSYPWIRRVIPNGVDLSDFRPGEKEATPTVLFVGTYHNRKRGKLLMDAFAKEVRPRIPDAKLWMVCSDAPREPGVEVLGQISAQELADRYRRAWVFCLPSSYEGFGVPYIEAMASGTPVIATPNLGAREVLGGGRYGRIVEPMDLGGAITSLLNDRAERDRMSCLGLERVQEFGWEQVASQYEHLYFEVIDKRCATASSPNPCCL